MQLYEVLRGGVEANVLVCPVPYETQIESSLCSTDRLQAINDALVTLSLGIRFKDFGNLLIEETLALVRPNTRPSAFELSRAPLMNNDVAPTWRDVKREMQDRYKTLPVDRARMPHSRRRLFQSLSQERCRALYRDLKCLQLGIPCDQGNIMSGQLCTGLQVAGVTHEEVASLLNAILSHRWEAIPILFYHNLLSSQAEHDYIRGRKPKSNDDVDRYRTAIALFAADYYLTERSMAETCRKVRTAEVSPTKVFSIHKDDLKEMTITLRRSIGTIASVVWQ